MDTTPQHKRFHVILVALLLIALLACSGFLFYKSNSLERKLGTAVSDLHKLQEYDKQQDRSVQSTVDYSMSLQRPAVMVKENLVAIPELKITLPYNNITKTLLYSMDDIEPDDSNDLRVTSTHITDTEERQLSCSGLVRINMKSGTPYSPWEETAGSVKLSDGRTLHIVAAKAFKNNEASTKECETEVWHQITPKQVADEFKKAVAY